MQSGHIIPHAQFVRRYHAGELDTTIPEEAVDEVLLKRKIETPIAGRASFVATRKVDEPVVRGNVDRNRSWRGD